MNRLADYKTLLFNNEPLHLPFFSSFLHPIPFWLPAQNNLSPFNDMQMNFHEPHDPMRWLNWDDISCHAAATVTVSVCLLSLSLSLPSFFVSTTTANWWYYGVHCHHSLMNLLCERRHSAYPVLFQRSFSNFDTDGASEHEMLVHTPHVVVLHRRHTCYNNIQLL